MDYKDLTPDQLEKAKACTTTEELVALAQSEGIALTDEELNALASGGTCWTHSALDDGCPKCKSKNLKVGNIGQIMKYECKDCGYKWQ